MRWMHALVPCALAACGSSRGAALGDTRWVTSLGDPGPGAIRIAADPGGDVVAGGRGSLARLSGKDGATLWTAALPDRNLDHVVIDREHAVIASGSTFGIARYDASGTRQWQVAPPLGTTWTDVAVADDGTIYYTGDADITTLVVGALAKDGTELWSRSFHDARNSASTFRIAITTDGRIAVTGKTDDVSAFGLPDHLPCQIVARLTDDNLFEGARVLSWDTTFAIAADHSGGLVASVDDALVDVDRYGWERWDATSQLAQAYSVVAVTRDDKVVAAGLGGFEGFDAAGQSLDIVPFGNDPIAIQGLAALPDRSVAFSGETPVAVDFGTGPVQGVFVGMFGAPP